MNTVSGMSLPRLLRAAVFAAVCVGVSSAGHTLGSGHELPWAGPVAGFVLVFALAWAAAGREQDQTAICGWMLWSQVALHVLFARSQAGPGPAVHAGHPHPAAEAATAVPEGGSGLGMLLAHLAAALISAWWLRKGEAAAFALLRLARMLFFGLLLLVVAAAAPEPERQERTPPPSGPGPCLRTPAMLRYSVVLRGPPMPSAA